MSLAYTGRLLCLAAATFFLVNLAAGLVVRLVAHGAGQLAARMRARDGASLLLALRCLPCAAGAMVVACLAVPGYLRWEPQGIDEAVGWPCLAAAGLGVLVCLLSAIRAGNAILRARRFVRGCPERMLTVGGEQFRVCVTGWRQPLFAMAGVLRPRLIVAETALSMFPGDELVCVLRHERAHGESHDNLKRLLLLLAPDCVPFVAMLRPLERAWCELAEWTADDRAAAESPSHAVSLASALVRAARLAAWSSEQIDLVTPLLRDGHLEQRIDRLLEKDAHQSPPWARIAGPVGVVLLSAVLAAMMQYPAALGVAHRLLERLVQ